MAFRQDSVLPTMPVAFEGVLPEPGHWQGCFLIAFSPMCLCRWRQ